MKNNDLSSSATFTKADGKPIKFNFQLENGLPYKPIITPPFDLFKNKKDSSLSIQIFIDNKQLSLMASFSINDIYIEYNKNEWFILEKTYIVLNNLPDIIVNNIRNKKFYILFSNAKKIFFLNLKFHDY